MQNCVDIFKITCFILFSGDILDIFSDAIRRIESWYTSGSKSFPLTFKPAGISLSSCWNLSALASKSTVHLTCACAVRFSKMQSRASVLLDVIRLNAPISVEKVPQFSNVLCRWILNWRQTRSDFYKMLKSYDNKFLFKNDTIQNFPKFHIKFPSWRHIVPVKIATH